MSNDECTELDHVIAEYLQAVEAGNAPDQKELLSQHPDLAFAVGLFVLALLMPLNLHWGPLGFGIFWGLCLAIIARRLQSLASA